MSLLSPWEIVVRGESGRNEFLRGPFALFEAHSRAKFVRNLIKHGWASMSPPELIPPPSPSQVDRRGLKTQAQFLSLTPALVPSATDCLHRQAGMPPVAATTSTGSILTH